MNKRLVGLAALAGVAWSTPALAAGQCVTFDAIGNGARTTYDPFSPSPAVEFFDLKIKRLDDRARGVRFVLADISPRAAGPGIGPLGPEQYGITWQQDTGRTAFVVGNAQPIALLSPEVVLNGNGNAADVSRFAWTVSPGQQASAQQHREPITIRYQCLDASGAPLGPVEEQTFGLELILTVRPYAAAYIGSIGNTRGAIDFGAISGATANLSKAIGITAQSTLPYQVDVRTDNAQRLKRDRRDTDGIDYTMKYRGVAIADGDTMVCPITAAPAGTAGQFEVTLDRQSIARQLAGHYSDTVTLTITPRDSIPVSSCAVAP